MADLCAYILLFRRGAVGVDGKIYFVLLADFTLLQKTNQIASQGRRQRSDIFKIERRAGIEQGAVGVVHQPVQVCGFAVF